MKEKINVCLMNDSFPPLIDGVANTVVNYASIIEEKYGHAIVSTPDYPGVKDDYPFEVMRYPSINTTKLVGYRAGMPLDVSYLAHLSNKDIDIIHSHCPIASTILARIVRDTNHKPIIMTYHTKFDIELRKAINFRLIQNTAISTLIKNIEAVDEVWVVSRGAGENLKSMGYKGDYIVMTNGVDLPKGKVSRDRINRIRQEYLLPENCPVFLFVGRMQWYKGIKIIIDALRNLSSRGMDYRMMFVGDGADRIDIQDYAIEKGIFEKCIFTGPIRDRERLRDIYSSCDLFLFPSTFDTNGIVVREAAASGLGSVLIKDSCAAEDVTGDENALLIEENSESLTDLLVKLGDNLSYMHTIGENAMNQIYCSWDDSVARAVERYRYVIDNVQYHKPTLFDENSTVLDNFFSLWADIVNTIDKTRKIGEDVNSRLYDMLDRYL